MRRRKWGFAPLAALVVLSGCTATASPTLTSEQHDFGAEADEKKLLQTAGRFDRGLAEKGFVLQDKAVEEYVQRVGARLVPASAARAVTFRFRVLRDPLVNAFALPNGSIYVNVALLARLENEAQLAQVLGHEIGHVVARHSLDRERTRTSSRMAANIARIALAGLPIGDSTALAVMASHSREHEIEADHLGLQYMAAAGYPLSEVDRLFTLMQEIKPWDAAAGSIYSSHPDNQERAERTRSLVGSGELQRNAGASNHAREYAAVRHAVALENIRLKLNIRQYRLAADAAEAALAHALASPWLHYYRGEAYRLMAEDPGGAAHEQAQIAGLQTSKSMVADMRQRKPELLRSAKQSFEQCLANEAQFAHAYRGLGLVALAEGDQATARDALKRYLDNAPDITDRRYITNILGRIASQ